MLPVQRGDTSNSVGVMTRLDSSKAMLVFLCDYVEVLLRPAAYKATLEIKLKL